MNICFAVNEHYAIYLCVALKSILKNAAMDDIFHFWVFTPDLSETTKAELLKLKTLCDFSIDFIHIDAENELPDFPIWTAYNSKLAHYRFKIPMIMAQYGESRCLYLDADIIVNASLSNLYKTNLRGKAIGLVPSPMCEEEKKVIPLLHLSENHKYAYSGLMLVDVNEYVKQNIYGKASAIAKTKGENLYWPDMDILNLTLDGNNYCEIPPKYSINPGFKGCEGKTVFLEAYGNIFDNDTVLEALNNPIIYQLAGPAKPNSNMALSHIKRSFFEYTRGTLWKKQAKKWLPKSLLRKIGYFIWHKEKKEKNGQKIRRYKLFGITLIKTKKIVSLSFDRLNIVSSDRCLCICPHADDEIIGLGGLLLKKHTQFDVLCLNSSGVPYKNQTAKQRSDIRIAEFQHVMDTLGVNNRWIFEGYGNPPMYKDIDGHFNDYLKSVNISDYDYIFIPYENDSHPEHRYATTKIIPNICKHQGINKKAHIIMYEVWTPIQKPNRFLNISDVMQKKLDLLRLYKSQLQDGWDYDVWSKGLNQYRAMQAMGHEKALYVEVFEELTMEDYMRRFS